MPSIARVVVDLALDREFDYRIPAGLSREVAVGSRVTVPFGASTTGGYVVGLAGESAQVRLKEIAAVEGHKPYITPTVLALARWMAEYYCAPVELAIRTVLPGAVRRRGARFKTRRFAEPLAAEDGASLALPGKQQLVLDELKRTGGEFVHTLLESLGVTEAPLKALEKRGLCAIRAASVMRSPSGTRRILQTKPLELMPEQRQALELIKNTVNELPPASGRPLAGVPGRVVLLYGVTGSGKTEVYLQAIDQVLSLGKGAIVLVPEISLTPQTVERFVSRFGERIAVLHSHLSDGERHDEWHRIRDGEATIVVGARSALFAPVRNLGLIVVDEEHEPSYKQDEAPGYHARDVAVMRGVMEGCTVVLGSATPSIESWFNANTGKYRLATLTHRADHRRMPAMRVVDMRVEAQRTGKPSVFSRELIEALRSRLERAEQSMLFLNRRGFASSLICPRCGYVANCDLCSVAYTYHRADEKLLCHICGAAQPVPNRCPGCQDPAIKFAGIGTQRVESIIAKLFPRAVVQRMDADIMTAKDSYERILGAFRTGKIDILVGTQMIAKGLHFPNVTLVGVIYADLSLHMPDFRAAERTYQLLAQVSGRAGRGDVAGEVIVQTYTPFHPAIQAARRLDFEGLCDQELAVRHELQYPPFAHLVCLTLRGPSEEKVAFFAAAIVKEMRPLLPPHAVIAEPSPAPLARAKGLYRYHVMIRCPSTRAMTQPLRKVLARLRLPEKTQCTVDVDAIKLL